MKSTARTTPPPRPAPPVASRVISEPATVAACQRDYAAATHVRAAFDKQQKAG